MPCPVPRAWGGVGTSDDLGGTAFIGRGRILILMFSRMPLIPRGISAFTQMWSLVIFVGHLSEGKPRSYFLWQLHSRVICNFLHFPASWLFAWAMFLKSSKLWLAHASCVWNGKDFDPNLVAWVGFKSLSEMSSLEPGICQWHLWLQMRFPRLKVQEEVWITSR